MVVSHSTDGGAKCSAACEFFSIRKHTYECCIMAIHAAFAWRARFCVWHERCVSEVEVECMFICPWSVDELGVNGTERASFVFYWFLVHVGGHGSLARAYGGNRQARAGDPPVNAPDGTWLDVSGAAPAGSYTSSYNLPTAYSSVILTSV